jgi:predicted naringenin-chalcone synthase
VSGERPSIRGIGTALPSHPFAQEPTCEALIEALALDRAAARRVRAVYRRSRIERRHSVLSDDEHPLSLFGIRAAAGERVGTAERMALYREHAPPLALEACRALLADPAVPRPGAVTHVIVASCTGFLAPGLDVLLCRALELRADVGRTLVGFQGCQAGLSALRLADALCRADEDAAVLVLCLELSTLHFQASAADDDVLAGSLFSDGAAAALVAGRRVPRRAAALEVERAATCLHADSLEHMTWEVGDEGFALHLSRLLPRLVGFEFLPFVAGELALGDPAERERRFWAVHPGGAAILDSLEAALGLPTEALAASREVLAGHGNMSSATIWFVLDRLRRHPGLPERGAALAFGPGLSLEATLLRRLPA